MTKSQQDKIIRFSERVPDHLLQHWNEIINIINDIDKGNEIELSESQLREFYLKSKLEKACKNILILQQWTKENKIDSRTGFNNMCDYIAGNIREGVVKL